VIATGITRAQSRTRVDGQIWLDVNPAYYFNPHQQIYGDIGIRWDLEDKSWWRLVVRPSFRTCLGGRFYFSAGVGNFFTFNDIIDDRWEIRPFQGLSFNWPNWKTPVSHYIRLEERFDFNMNTWKSRNLVRLRYQLGISYRWAVYQPGRFWQVTAVIEPFLTPNGQPSHFQEQVRASLGLDRSYTRDLFIRLELTWQQERIFFNAIEKFSYLYFRLRFTKSWGEQWRTVSE
jgi:hypothetical protein